MALRIRFGLFDFDPDTGELRREGAPVRLQAQPAQVLAMLLEHAGEVVTREQLREAVWGRETFVDFDRGLNYCIAQIRAALGDSAESPRFVRTVPKRGYQFVAPITQAAISEPPPPHVTPKRPFAKYTLAVALAGFALVALFVAQKRSPVNIAVARFDNETGLAEMNAFADGLTDIVVADLTAGSGGRYAIIGNAALLRRTRADRDLTAIGSTLRAGYVILGQVQRSSSHIRVLAHLIRLPEQTHISVVRYDRDVSDQLQTESELGKLITAEFLRRLSSSPRTATN